MDLQNAVETLSATNQAIEPEAVIFPAQKGDMLTKIKRIAAYQSQPISAVTHVAPVKHIEPYGDSGKYKVVFAEPAKPITLISFDDAPVGFMQGTRYTISNRLLSAKSVLDLIAR